MLAAQITDLHLEPGPEIDGNAIETVARVVAHLNGFVPRPDLVVVTGDLVAREEAGHYQALAGVLGGLEMPCYVIPGNHDDRSLLREAFAAAGYFPDSGEFLHYTVEDFELRLVALDTHDPGKAGGLLCPARLDWLSRRLAEAPDRPTLIAMHHPPFETGIADFDNIGLSGRTEFGEIVSRNAQVQAIACGHVHRAIATSWCGALVTVTPSTGYQYALRLGELRGFKRVAEPPACRLFRWTPDGGLISHLSYVTA